MKGFTLIQLMVIIAVLGIATAVILPEFMDLEPPDAPGVVDYDYQQGLRDGMLATLKFDNFCYSGKSTKVQRDSASKEMAAFMQQDGPTYADSIATLNAALHDSDRMRRYLAGRINEADSIIDSLKEHIEWLWGLRNDAIPFVADSNVATISYDPSAGMVSIEAVEALFVTYIYNNPVDNHVAIPWDVWQRIKEGRE